MFADLSITGPEILLAIVLATAVYLAEVAIFSRRRRSKEHKELQKQLLELQVDLAALKTRVEKLEIRPPADSALDTQKTLHAEAVRMAMNGVTAQEMVGQLGISRTEADLIIALHKSDS